MIWSVACLLGDGSSQRQNRSSWNRRRERWLTVISSISHSWITQTVFFNLERIFWQFCKKLAVLGSAFLQMPHTVLYSSAWQPDFGSFIQSNNLSTRKWPLILTVPSCNGFVSLYLWGCVTRPWVTLMMQIYFLEPFMRSSILLYVADLEVCQLPPAKTVHSRWICQTFS